MSTAKKPKKTITVVVLSEEQIIDQVESRFLASHEGRDRNAANLPAPSYQLKVGMQMEIGNLNNPVIVKVGVDGKYGVYRHLTRRKAANQLDFVESIEYGVHFWYDMVPVESIKPTKFAGKRLDINYTTRALDDLLLTVIKYGVDDAPSFQRDYVWSLEDKQKLIKSVFESVDIGKFVFVKREFPFAAYVIDGKQRLNALVGFVLGQYPYEGYYWNELSQEDRRSFERTQVQFSEISERHYSQKDMINLFLKLNTGGVPQSEEHLARVRAMLDE